MVTVSRAMNRRRTGPALLKFPSDIGTHGMLINFRNYQYQQSRGLLSSTSDVTNSILLPLPKQLVDRTGVRTNKVDLGNLGELIATGASAAANAGTLGAIYESISALFPDGAAAADAVAGVSSTSMERSITGFMSQANFLLRSTLNKIDRGAGASLDIGTGNAINPKTALAFEGVELKSHTFDWEFAPKDENESETLNTIIKRIKRNMLPTYEDLSVGGQDIIQRAFLRYPSLAEIYLIGVNEQHFVTYKTGMIKSLDLNYSQGGQLAILKGGKPALIGMQLAFDEADIHTAYDYMEDEELRSTGDQTRR